MRNVRSGYVGGAAAAALAVACALGACTAEAEPIVTTTPSADPSPGVSSSPSPSPSPVVSEVAAPLTDEQLLELMPPGAAQEDLYGAMVTAQFFLEQYAPMFHTGDTRVWEALSGDDCGYCADALANAVRVRDEGWTARGGEIVVDERTIDMAFTSASTVYWSVEADVATATLAQDGQEERIAEEAGHAEFALELVYGLNRWVVDGVFVTDLS